MADYDSSLPIRTEADGTDERLHVKIVDGTNPSVNQTTVDSDKNLHVEIHGNDPAGVDRVVRTSEIGALTPDGVYNAADNTKPGNTGLIASVRDASPSDTTQTQRLTAVTNGSKRLLDISLHDEDGAVYSQDNPLPVSLEESEGAEVCDRQTTAVVAVNATVDHDYTVTAAKTLIIDDVWSSGSGKIKTTLSVETAPASGIFTVKFDSFNSTSDPNISIPVKKRIKVAAGVKVRISITNRDNQVQDVYSTLTGVEK